MIAFVNDHFIEEENATLQVGDLAIHRGYGVFDYLRTKKGVPLFLEDYLDRFYNSASMLRLQPAPPRQELTAIVHELIRKNGLPQSGVKIILTGGYSPESYQPVAPNLVVMEQAIQPPTDTVFSTGIKVITHEYQREFPEAKSINYLMGVWLQQEIRDRGAADVLYYKDGVVSEFPRSNVFIVTPVGCLVTPSENILHGITRKKLLELATPEMPVEVRPLYLEELMQAAEVFMTSTTRRLLPVTQVDGLLIGSGAVGPVTRLLNDRFIEMEDGFVAARHTEILF